MCVWVSLSASLEVSYKLAPHCPKPGNGGGGVLQTWHTPCEAGQKEARSSWPTGQGASVLGEARAIRQGGRYPRKKGHHPGNRNQPPDGASSSATEIKTIPVTRAQSPLLNETPNIWNETWLTSSLPNLST